ncbi:MAG TPA: uroporphyrinogen-III C-methyltransferase [Puia sp.]|nr:uroporphyrinogen-III C-methyltransferase [Puia sp.]
MIPAPTVPSELILMGAGPGDPDLLTVKAWRTLRKADTLLYDRLVHPAVLDLAPAGCERINVGKLPDGPSTSQDTIHRLIREKSAKGGIIVRLKGGDPFIFGRGFEEAIIAHSFGLKVTYIPGVTSMQTSGLVQIPLTHRSVSEGIWILTGTRKDGSLSADLQLAIKSRSTVVIYMGMRKLGEISAVYRREGKAETPAAIIRNGSLTHQKLALGTAASLPAMAAAQGLTNPAIVVIGEVVEIGKKAGAGTYATGAAGAGIVRLAPGLGIGQELGKTNVR